ncbi:peptide MFS transporter [Siphonobacter aquaeclarae]|uniref:Proton-dependent oligopeptide transporter, POT family n=1 Tax=Siphonobacter aquaeclarae TaxID=563176 RepID=A0A1G9IEB8_9BACT|nr:peptide MFS transporter [Siphonobacter aquaeclarae]SDL23598.1 proton-dependent oligopeptide transporter, POT family [Siphonobacter aquaeclarae]
MSQTSSSQWLGHPRGLFILFLTELWERFSFYGMRAILVLYLTAPMTGLNPGLGWSNAEALTFYGWYGFSVYMASLPGGYLADKWLGQKKTVMIGAILLTVGHGILAIQAMWAFYLGIFFIVSGVGLLKPNISTMVGGLYGLHDTRRDKGFTIFYIGINIGAAIAPLLVGWVAYRYGWHYGFGLAGVGMALGFLGYLQGQKYLQSVGNFLGTSEDASDREKLHKPLTPVEKDRVLVLVLSFLIVIIFWGAYEQAGGLMNLYAEQKTDRHLLGMEIPASWFQSLPGIFVISLGTIVAAWWSRRAKKGKESSSLAKLAIGTMITGSGFFFMTAASLQYAADGKAAMYWLVLAYLFHVIGELSSSPVSLSFITKLAPAKYASMMMGLYWAATGMGEKLAGTLGAWSQTWGEFETFTGIAVFCVLFGGLILLLLKPLKRLTHGADDDYE